MKKSCVKLVAISMAVGLLGFNVPSNMQAQEITNTITSKSGDGIALANEDEGSDTEQVRYGEWVLVNGRYKFQFDEGDFAVNERLEINGKTYAFDKYGYMITTGWFQEDKFWYYFDKNGAMHYGWLQLDSKWYYFDLEYGYMYCYSWAEIDGDTYSFDENGVMDTGWYYHEWDDGDSAWFYYYPNGKEARGWLQIGDNWYYMDPEDGSMHYNIVEYIDNGNYYFTENGTMYKGWLQYEDDWYFFNDSGRMVMSAWADDYYFDSNGIMAKDTWIDGYYVGTDGKYRPAQWVQANDKWWYKHQDGSHTSNDFELIGGQTYYFDENGYMVKGWKQVGTNWYYFNESGHMLKNQWLGDYYFGSDGVMATNTWIGNYYVGADGKWIRDYQ